MKTPEEILTETTSAAAKAALQNTAIAQYCIRSGFPLGSRVTLSGVYGVGIVVGYNPATLQLLVEIPNLAGGPPINKDHLAQRYQNKILTGRIWDAAATNVMNVTAAEDGKIRDQLATLGLSVGQKVMTQGAYPGLVGYVAGIRNNNPVISLSSTDMKMFATIPLPDERSLHSSFASPTANVGYVAFSPHSIKEAKTAQASQDEAVLARLKNDGLELGQTYHWKTPDDARGSRTLLIIGHDGTAPIVVFNDFNGVNQAPGVQYMPSPERHLHSRYAGTSYKSFSLHKSLLQSSTERLEYKKKIEVDQKIVNELANLRLNVGDEVEFTVNERMFPTNERVTDKSVTRVGYVVGFYSGRPIVAVKEIPTAWSAVGSDSIYSAYRTNASLKYLSFRADSLHRRALSKPAARLAPTQPASSLSELRKMYGHAPTSFPEIAVSGLSGNKYAPLKANLKKAGYRIVGKQALKLTHGAIVNSLKNKGVANGKVQALASLLDTEYGKAAIAITLGMGMAQLPSMINYDGTNENMARLQELAKEFRVSGLTLAGNELVETIFKSALEVMLSQNEQSKIRVVSEDSTLIEDYLNEDSSSLEEKKRSA